MKTREAKLVVLLLGFLSGNLFGTLLSFLRQFFVWDVLIIIILLLAGEIISYISYNKKYSEKKTNETFPLYLWARALSFVALRRRRTTRPFLPFRGTERKGVTRTLPCCAVPLRTRTCDAPSGHRKKKQVEINGRHVKPFYFNFFKMGVMIGFFVDAFKVGS